jgi:hypothetical protein
VVLAEEDAAGGDDAAAGDQTDPKLLMHNIGGKK